MVDEVGLVEGIERSWERRALLTVVTLLAFGAFLLILWPFVTPIAWALCLAVATGRPYRGLVTQLGNRPRLAALVMVLLVPVALLVPLMLVGGMLVDEVKSFDVSEVVAHVEAGLAAGGEAGSLRPRLDSVAKFLGYNDFEALSEALQKGGQELARRFVTGSLAKGVLDMLFAPFLFLFGFVVMLITLYFVYCDGKRLRDVVLDVSPFTVPETERILDSLHGTTTAALLGGVLVALIQGALGSVSFAIAGLDAPVLWGLVMAGASLFPFGGTALVWAPAAVYLFITGSTGAGIFLVIWGLVIVGMADNVLRPWILSRTGAHDVHPMMLFFAIMSGIGLFGISGVVFGPLLLALITTVLRIYREREGARTSTPAGASSLVGGDGDEAVGAGA